MHRIRKGPLQGKWVAAKIPKPSAAEYANPMDEIRTNVRLQPHPHIVAMYGWVMDRGAFHCIVLERMCSSLRSYWKSQESLLEAEMSLKILRHTFRALSHMHGLKVAHLDLTMNNVLLQWGTHGVTVKLADFGCAEYLVDGSNPNPNAIEICTWTYRAPEIVFGLPYGFAADVWSAGVIARELFLGISMFDVLKQEISPAAYIYAHVGVAISEATWPGVTRGSRYISYADCGMEQQSWTRTRFEGPTRSVCCHRDM
jgi:serine/threonine protein kinase